MKRYINILFVALSLLVTSCSDSFFDINTDPNNPAAVTPNLVLPSAIGGSAYVIGGYYQAIGGFWSQHYAQSTGASQWASWEEYTLDEGDFDRQFQSIYSGTLMDCESIKKSTIASQDWSYYLIATLVQSYSFQVLADLYDQIPFSEALAGTSNLSPKYEKGKDVGDSLIKRIDAALAKDFTLSSVSTKTLIGSSDLLFQGDLKKWIQFANSLKLKIYLRYVNADPTKYAAAIKALLVEDNFLQEDAKMTAFKNEENNRNPFYETFLDRLSGNVVASKTLMDKLQEEADPRLPFIFNPAATGNTQVGLGQGRYKEDQAIYATIKNLSTPNIAPIFPVYFFTAAEVWFLKAEAELRYGSASKAEVDYKNGIDASFSLYGAIGASALYADGKPYAFDKTNIESGIKSIITQKWIAAANVRALESFFDKNRTGYPDIFVKSAVSTLGTSYPQRLLFPLTERKSNSNTPALQRITEKVWWAK